jgi:hypothetical protein
MMFDKPREERSKNGFDFYFKHCSLVGRHPYPDKDEFLCSEP